jgi:hypothetical protein
MLAIEGVAVGIAKRDYFFFLAVGMDAKDLVQSFVAHIQKSFLIPNRSFGESETGCHSAELGVAIHEAPKIGRCGLQLKLSGGVGGTYRGSRVERNQE